MTKIYTRCPTNAWPGALDDLKIVGVSSNWADHVFSGLGRVNCLAVDPADANTIYAGTPADGLWRTTNAGGAWSPGTATDNWTPLTDGLPSIGVSGIAIDYTSPLASRVLYILTGDGDGGIRGLLAC
ncbi:MAG: hypothetical protein ACOYPR_18930 [Saprospiraceae bacterium]